MQHSTFTFRTIIKLFTALFLVVLATGLYAQATLSVQGVLTKSDGTAVDDGTYSLRFRLFDDSTGGNQVHSEIISVETIGGVYSTILGKNSSSPLTASFNTIYYLSVVAGSTELLPRPQLTHAPYALSLLGQSNKFPSTGKVEADYIDAKYITVPAGEPSVGVAGKGYSFSAGGDADGGMFSNNDNNVSLWANHVKKIELSNTSNTLFGATTLDGNTIANGWIDASGVVQANAFTLDPNNISGVFSNSANDALLKSTNNNSVLVGSNGINYLTGSTVIFGDVEVSNNVRINGELRATLPFGNHQEMQYQSSTGRFFFDNSSRRYKRDITPLADDFKLILKAQPKTYTRPNAPGRWELGYIAEEMDSLGLNKLVFYNENGIPDGYNYGKMILYVTEVLKMHNADIEALQQEVAALKAEKTQLQSTNAALNTSLQNQQSAFSAQLSELSKRMKLLETSNEMKKSAPGKK